MYADEGRRVIGFHVQTWFPPSVVQLSWFVNISSQWIQLDNSLIHLEERSIQLKELLRGFLLTKDECEWFWALYDEFNSSVFKDG